MCVVCGILACFGWHWCWCCGGLCVYELLPWRPLQELCARAWCCGCVAAKPPPQHCVRTQLPLSCPQCLFTLTIAATIHCATPTHACLLSPHCHPSLLHLVCVLLDAIGLQPAVCVVCLCTPTVLSLGYRAISLVSTFASTMHPS